MDIYKITNKHSGKSYIGRSIYCGCAGEGFDSKSQFIDQMIQFDGIDSYSFELLKVVGPQGVDYWENYYINKYNTMFPNGYNIQWNSFTYNQSTVAPAETVQTKPTSPRIWTDVELTESELTQLKEWQNFIWDYDHGKIEFYSSVWGQSFIESERAKLKKRGIKYYNLSTQLIIQYAPRTVYEYKNLKLKVEIMNNELPILKYYLPELSRAVHWKTSTLILCMYNEIRNAINDFNNGQICYEIDKFGRISLKNNDGHFKYDEGYRCLKIEVDNCVPGVVEDYGKMFEEGLLPKENVKIVDKNGKFVDFSQLTNNAKNIRAILFF